MTKPTTQSDKTDPSVRSKNPTEVQRELDPRAELGLTSPVKESAAGSETPIRQESKGQKATQFDGNPNPQGSPSSIFKPKDDTPMKLKKSKGPRDDQ